VDVELDLTGTWLGPWRLEHLLGEGAMARVYQARDAGGRVTAVKVLRWEHAKDAELVSRFVREARDACSAGPLPLEQAVRICVQVAWALDAAHQIGVVHRDIKPENIFLNGPKGDVKVLDFGMAKLLEPIGELPKSGTIEGVVLGTPEYMAPEQALGHQVDRRADIYAVGLMLYELLLGTRPFSGETFGKLLVQITSTPAPRLPDRLPSGERVPPALADVVAKCLSKSPDDRFGSAEELARALEPFSGLPPAPPRTLQVRRPAPALSAADEAAMAAAVKGSMTPKVVAVLVALALVAAALVLFLR